MKEKSCRCGASKKRFRFDIGPYYVGECCTAAGYDELGNPKNSITLKSDGVTEVELSSEELVTPGPNEGEAPESSPEETSTLRSFFGLGSSKLKAGGRGKLMDMNVDQLKAMAKEKGIEVGEMNKKQIVAAILG